MSDPPIEPSPQFVELVTDIAARIVAAVRSEALSELDTALALLLLQAWICDRTGRNRERFFDILRNAAREIPSPRDIEVFVVKR